MSAGAVVQAALVAAVRGDPDLAVLTAVFDAPPVRAALPYAVIDDPVLGTWGAKDVAGREGRVAVVLHDAGERPLRLRALIGAVEARIEALAGEIGDGWRIAGVRLARSRIVRAPGAAGGEGRWVAASEFAVRVYRVS